MRKQSFLTAAKGAALALPLFFASSVVTSNAASAQAVGETVSAADPQGIAAALRLAGYTAKITTDGRGDPMIETKFGGWKGKVMFYGCDSETNDGCDSVLLSTGFNRANPMSAEMVNQLVSRKRFTSIRLDDEGDPFIEWDIVLSEPIPTGVFLRSVQLYSSSLDDIADTVFAEERAADGG
jgi:hypothetical protein